MKPHFSPSQISSASRCLRRWHYESVQGRRSPETESQRRGHRIHKMLEVYVNDPAHPLPTAQETVEVEQQLPYVQVLPDGRVTNTETVVLPCEPMEQKRAEGALHHIPNPAEETVVAEGEFLLADEHTGFGKPTKGFVDVWVPGKRQIVDWKTRSSDRYDKDEEELRHDPQAIIYGKLKLLEVQPDPDGKRRVNFRHVNIYMDGKRPRTVDLLDLDEDEIEQGLARLRKTTQRMLIAETLDVLQVPVNMQACGDYRGCAFRMECAGNGFPVHGDNFVARQQRELAKSEGRYFSPEFLEEQMAGFGSSLSARKTQVQVNPPDGLPSTVVGELAQGKDAAVALTEGGSEAFEEGAGEAPAEAVIATEEPRVLGGKGSAKDQAIAAIMEYGAGLSNQADMDAFYDMLGFRPASPEELRKNLQGRLLNELRKMVGNCSATAPAAQAPAPAPAAGAKAETVEWVNKNVQAALTAAENLGSLEDVERLKTGVATLIGKHEETAAAVAKRLTLAKERRARAEDEDDAEGVAKYSADVKTCITERKLLDELLKSLTEKCNDKLYAEATKRLTPVVQPAAVAPTVKTVTPTKTQGHRPMLLIRSQLICNESTVLHIDPLLPKYQAAVAAAAGVSTYHEVKFEGAMRVAALLAADIAAGTIAVHKYSAVSVPHRGGAYDAIIDVLRPVTGFIIEGNGR